MTHSKREKWFALCSPDLSEVDGEDGVRAAADVIHAGAGGGAVDVSSLHQLLHVTVVLHQVFGQIWVQEGRGRLQEVNTWTKRCCELLTYCLKIPTQLLIFISQDS